MYQDLGDTYSKQRDECNDGGCIAAAYYASSSCYNSSKKLLYISY